MRKVVTILSVLIMCSFLLCGCKEESEPESQPVGVSIYENETYGTIKCYRVIFPDEYTIEQLFELTGKHGKTHITGDVDGGYYSYSQTSDGGWVGWNDSRFVFIDGGVDENKALMQMSLAFLAQSAMSFEEAKNYISFSFLKE